MKSALVTLHRTSFSGSKTFDAHEKRQPHPWRLNTSCALDVVWSIKTHSCSSPQLFCVTSPPQTIAAMHYSRTFSRASRQRLKPPRGVLIGDLSDVSAAEGLHLRDIRPRQMCQGGPDTRKVHWEIHLIFSFVWHFFSSSSTLQIIVHVIAWGLDSKHVSLLPWRPGWMQMDFFPAAFLLIPHTSITTLPGFLSGMWLSNPIRSEEGRKVNVRETQVNSKK